MNREMAMFFPRYILACVILGSIRGSENVTEKPNIILILTDDQDVMLQGLIPMYETQKSLAFHGMTFMNAFTSSPICCPSRASILSGQYAHNHATVNNSASGGCYGDYWTAKVEPRALPVQLQSHGYETFFAGKYLNEYFVKTVPPGWTEFYGLHGNSRYYNFTLTENGRLVSYQDKYYTDVIRNQTMNFLTTTWDRKYPFFAMIAPPAPHAPYTPAPRHNTSFEGVKALRTPNFNIKSGTLDKHWLLTMQPPLSEDIIDNIDLYYRKRWQTLLAVDEMVREILEYLETTNLISNTYIVYTSDNGYHMGQFGQPYDKRQPYETDIRVPFIVRGPNIPKKSITTAPVTLVDLFPTFLEWAGVEANDFEDGLSFHAVVDENETISNNLEDQPVYKRQILIEYWGEGNTGTYNPDCPWPATAKLAQCTLDAGCRCEDSWNNTYTCVRHFDYETDLIYCEFQDNEHFVEAYDLHTDPYQMRNIGNDMLPIQRALYSLKLGHLRECIGIECRI